jgi:hypothetical protein
VCILRTLGAVIGEASAAPEVKVGQLLVSELARPWRGRKLFSASLQVTGGKSHGPDSRGAVDHSFAGKGF